MTRVVVMGVSGSGKSTVGSLLASQLAVPFAEGDDFHSEAAIAKMSAGVPLDDADRRPWLGAVAMWLADRPLGAVTACSALRRRYRDLVRARVPDVFFLHLAIDPSTAEQRLSHRPRHFMPASLVASQFATLEELEADEDGLRVDATLEPDVVCRRVLAALAERPASPRILCVGEIMLDVLVTTGERHGPVVVRAGGTPVNAARAIGEGALVVGRIGDDVTGAAVRAGLAGFATRLAVDGRLPTGTYVELADGTVHVHRGANAALTLADVVPAHTQAVLVSGYVGAAPDILESVDARWRAFVATPTTTQVPAAANVVFANDEEARRLGPGAAEVVVVTHGPAGATLRRGGVSTRLEPTGITGTGAGDALAGRILASLARG